MAPLSRIPGFTSTGSKRPAALFGDDAPADLPRHMVRSSGCTVWDERGREYLDLVMALGAVALGYGRPEVTAAVAAAAADGVVGPLAPALEEELADRIARLAPWVERVRFLKTGAEAMAAAVRIARAHTGRERVLGCGYHGWLDWCQAADPAVPAGTRALYAELPFNDVERTRAMIRAAGSGLAAVAIEPVVVEPPHPEWLAVVREETERGGAVFIVDEVKTVGRLALGGGCERYGIRPDLVVMGKAIANGFPLALVGGRADVMVAATRTWISSTLATEFVSLAAARASLDVLERERVPAYLWQVGGALYAGFERMAAAHRDLIAGVAGVAPMGFLKFTSEETSAAVARECARRGLIMKRGAYNFVSLAHDATAVCRALDVLDEVLDYLARSR
jgi:glutamate-1-semialdehyde 2,1-aminomutase